MSSRKERQAGALQRLESQLKDGVKTAKKSNEKVPLTDSDRKRIEKEIGALKAKA